MQLKSDYADSHRAKKMIMTLHMIQTSSSHGIVRFFDLIKTVAMPATQRPYHPVCLNIDSRMVDDIMDTKMGFTCALTRSLVTELLAN